MDAFTHWSFALLFGGCFGATIWLTWIEAKEKRRRDRRYVRRVR